MTVLTKYDVADEPVFARLYQGRLLLTNEMASGIEPTLVSPQLILDNECSCTVTPSGIMHVTATLDSEAIITVTPAGKMFMELTLDSEMECSVS
jgi:hypothetical protein